LPLTGNENNANNDCQPIINQHFSHMHVSFRLRIEGYSTRCQNMVPDLHDTRVRNRLQFLPSIYRPVSPTCVIGLCVTNTTVTRAGKPQFFGEKFRYNFLKIFKGFLGF